MVIEITPPNDRLPASGQTVCIWLLVIKHIVMYLKSTKNRQMEFGNIVRRLFIKAGGILLCWIIIHHALQ